VTATSAPPQTTDEKLPPGTRLVIGLLVVSAFVVILNETIMSVALPRLTEDLGITLATAQWLTTGFLLTMAVVIPTTGFLLQRFPMRAVFITAMSLFSLGTLIAATALEFPQLLAGRIVQASGTAIMMPLLITTVLNVVPPARRGQTMGTISIVIAVAPAIGPTVSGLILSVLEWRWMFWLVLPIALAALVIGAIKVQNLTTPRKSRLDVLSLLLSTLGFGGLIFGLASIGESSSGHTPVPIWIPLVVGAVSLALFVWRQLMLQRTDSALMDLRTFRSRTFSLSVVMIVISFTALFGSLVLLPVYLQQVLALDTLTVGLMLLPGGIVMGILSPIVGRLFDRVGPRPLVIPGTIIVSAALWSLTTLGETTPIALIIGIHCLLNIGLGFTFTPLMTSGLGSLPRTLYSHGSATLSTLQQLAGAAGTAVFVTLMTTGAAAGVADGLSQVSATAAGVQTAFFVGAIISLFSVAASFFVRRPVNAVPAGAVH